MKASLLALLICIPLLAGCASTPPPWTGPDLAHLGQRYALEPLEEQPCDGGPRYRAIVATTADAWSDAVTVAARWDAVTGHPSAPISDDDAMAQPGEGTTVSHWHNDMGLLTILWFGQDDPSLGQEHSVDATQRDAWVRAWHDVELVQGPSPEGPEPWWYQTWGPYRLAVAWQGQNGTYLGIGPSAHLDEVDVVPLEALSSRAARALGCLTAHEVRLQPDEVRLLRVAGSLAAEFDAHGVRVRMDILTGAVLDSLHGTGAA